MTGLMFRAHGAVQRAKRTGQLVVPALCEDCGTVGRVEAAHEDYARPLDVRWLCKQCHCRWDKATPKSGGEWDHYHYNRIYVNLTPAISKQVRSLAAEERRTVTAQVELLLERGLRSYGLEVAAA